MKTLILSCSTGEGHNSCAKAIKEYYESRGEICEILDGLELISHGFSRFFSHGHSFIYRHLPWLFKHGYGFTERHPDLLGGDARFYRYMARGTDALYGRILDGGYDAVICVHVFTALMMTELLKKYPIRIATCFVATDYTCCPGVKHTALDRYAIPSPSLGAEFLCDTVTEDKLIPCGIPVGQSFYSAGEKADARRAANVQTEHKHLLMMCGSMGCGPMKKLLKKISRRLPEDWELTVICGKNRRLEKKLKRRYAVCGGIHVRGYVEDMSTLMDSADLYLTKAGGISVSEAAVKTLPMVLIDAVAGCEEYNRAFFLREGGARTADTPKELAELCLNLMQNGNEREEMKRCLAKIREQSLPIGIWQAMKDLTERRNETKNDSTGRPICGGLPNAQAR